MLQERELILRRDWHKKNRDSHNKQKRDYYKKNKKIWKDSYIKNKNKCYSRKRTSIILIRNPELLKRVCKECFSLINLEIHHEIYPIEDKEIIKEIQEEKIYFLCEICHNFLHLKN